jgi:nucleoside-diphosphate-sugar epimerase
MTTVLVTGAAGNLGRRVTAALAAREHTEWVLAVDRVPTPVTSPKVEAHTIDLSAPSATDELAALAKQASAVLHLAWKPDGGSNLAVLRHVLDAVEAVEPSQVVHLSSATVYGAWADNPVPLTEESAPRPNPELAYAAEKRAAEVMVEDWAVRHPEVAVALLRPACTVGSTEEPLYQALAKSRKPPVGAEERVVQYLHIDDLASAVVHAYEQCLAGTYNVAPDSGVREEIAGALAGGSAVLPLPSSWRANLSDWQWRLRHGGPPPGARAYAQHSWVIAADKLRATGWLPQYSSEQALVVSDKKAHWDDLPAGVRVSVTLGAVAGSLVALGAAGTAWWRRRR